jgi:glycerol-3-phosphate dehydrogenase subunit C
VTITYDPFHPAYLDESDLRQEMDRVFDLCQGCRLCFKFCTSFPTLFEMVDEFEDQDASKMTSGQQDQVVDECFQCKLCYVNCPYIPGQSEWELDFPRLMMRADQVRHANERRSPRQVLADQALGRTDAAGKVNTKVAAPVNKLIANTGGAFRTLMEKTVGIASERLLPPYARTRFTTWFARRTASGPDAATARASATVFPTCLVEYQTPGVGQDLVAVYERNDVACDVPDGMACCGAPWLHQGNVDQFRKLAEKNVAVLAGAIRSAEADGRDTTVVVPQPTCGYILKHDYPDYLATDDARLVADHTEDACEFLVGLHKGDGPDLDTEFGGEIPESITYHAPCHLRAQNVGLKSRDLLKLTGAKLTVVAECSAIDGTWGYRAENFETSRKVAGKMAKAIEKADDDVVAGDCHLANGGIVQETGRTPRHPLQIVARAYGIAESDDTGNWEADQ